jgi:hypothetical protein
VPRVTCVVHSCAEHHVLLPVASKSRPSDGGASLSLVVPVKPPVVCFRLLQRRRSAVTSSVGPSSAALPTVDSPSARTCLHGCSASFPCTHYFRTPSSDTSFAGTPSTDTLVRCCFSLTGTPRCACAYAQVSRPCAR